MTFNSEAELLKFLIPKCVTAVEKVEKEVYEEFAGKLNQYYGEFMPAEYIRTGALFGSLETTGTAASGNGAKAEVYFDTPSYAQGQIPIQSTPITGRMGFATWGGGQVLDTAMHGSHGGYVGGTAIWDESMAALGDIRGKLMSAILAQL